MLGIESVETEVVVEVAVAVAVAAAISSDVHLGNTPDLLLQDINDHGQLPLETLIRTLRQASMVGEQTDAIFPGLDHPDGTHQLDLIRPAQSDAAYRPAVHLIHPTAICPDARRIADEAIPHALEIVRQGGATATTLGLGPDSHAAIVVTVLEHAQYLGQDGTIEKAMKRFLGRAVVLHVHHPSMLRMCVLMVLRIYSRLRAMIESNFAKAQLKPGQRAATLSFQTMTADTHALVTGEAQSVTAIPSLEMRNNPRRWSIVEKRTAVQGRLRWVLTHDIHSIRPASTRYQIRITKSSISITHIMLTLF